MSKIPKELLRLAPMLGAQIRILQQLSEDSLSLNIVQIS